RLLGQVDAFIALTPLLHLGRQAEAHQLTLLLKESQAPGRHFLSAYVALLESASGQTSEAASLLTEFLSSGRLADASAADLTIFLQVALRLRHLEAVERISVE